MAPAEAQYLKALRGFFQPILEAEYPEKGSMLVLALDEACSNVVKHRRNALMEGMVHVRATIGGGAIRIEIGDFCGTDDIPNIKPRDLADVRPGGLGTHFIAEIMDSVSFQPEPGFPGRMALVLEKRTAGTGSPAKDEGAQDDGD